jgi:hypothetical protein
MNIKSVYALLTSALLLFEAGIFSYCCDSRLFICIIVVFSVLRNCIVTVMGYHTRHPKHCDHFLIYCAFPFLLLIIPDSSTRPFFQ